MIIFQTAAGSCQASGLSLDGLLEGSLGLRGSSLSHGSLHQGPSTTTFQTNDYIHHLNRALQAEMRAISVYQTLMTSQSSGNAADRAATHAQNHQQAGKDLVCLIIANRGIPDERATLNFGLTKTFVQICTKVPVKIFARATTGTILTIERQLVATYARLLLEAPARDHSVLDKLLRSSEQHIANLS